MRARKLYQYSLEGVFIKEYESIRAAAMAMGVNCANMNKCANGKQMELCGYIWLASKDDAEAKRVSVLLNRPMNNYYDMNEEWRDIPGYEGLYQVSASGMVRSLYERTNQRGYNLIKAKEHSKMPYLSVPLYKDGGYKLQRVHRLVAMAFIPIPIIYHKSITRTKIH